MKAKISNVLLTLSLAAAIPMVGSAATFPLALGIVGNASVTNTTIDFGVFPTGAPYAAPGGYGTFEVNLVNAGPFQANGVVTGESGMIQSLSAATFPPTTAFMRFTPPPGGGAGLQLFATQVTAGAPGGGSCVLSPGGVFLLCDTSSGATATTNINGNITGDVTNPGGTDTYMGVFQATFAGMTVAQLLAQANAGTPINSPFSATFTATVTAVPEPVTFLLMGMGLLGAGLAVRRNKARG